MILKEALQIAFNDINDYREDNSIRAGVNFLSQEHALIYEKLESLYDKSNLIETNEHINDASNINITGENIIKLKTYLCNTYTLKSNYISRNIFSDDGAKGTTATLFFNQNKILLLGEPGSGKTIEAINLLHEICKSDAYRECIPVFFRLAEYGKGSENLFDGVRTVVAPFLGKISDKIILELIETRKLVFILDGFDEITSKEYKSRFVSEINRILGMTNLRCFITSRINQYHSNFCNINQYELEDFSQGEIIRVLHNHNIYNIPDIYLSLIHI